MPAAWLLAQEVFNCAAASMIFVPEHLSPKRTKLELLPIEMTMHPKTRVSLILRVLRQSSMHRSAMVNNVHVTEV
jgi:hypothetical protein